MFNFFHKHRKPDYVIADTIISDTIYQPAGSEPDYAPIDVINQLNEIHLPLADTTIYNLDVNYPAVYSWLAEASRSSRENRVRAVLLHLEGTKKLRPEREPRYIFWIENKKF